MSTTTRRSVGVSIILLALVLLFAMLFKAPAQSSASTLVPTVTQTPTATLDPSAFSLDGASIYKTPDDVIEIMLPKAWQASPSATEPNVYWFDYGGEQLLAMRLAITTPFELDPADAPTNAKEVMQATHDHYEGQIKSGSLPPGSSITAIVPVKIGNLVGVGYTMTVSSLPSTISDIRSADLPDGRILFMFVDTNSLIWPTAKPVVDRMIDSLVVNFDAIPTLTPTPSPIALELTATSLQDQLNTVEAKIQALTATP